MGWSGWVGGARSPAATWTSPDGITWSRVPHDEEAVGAGMIWDVIITDTGLVAVGTDGTNAVVWLGPDSAAITVPASTTTATNPFVIGDRSDDKISDICKEVEENYTYAVSAAETRHLWYVTSTTADGSGRLIDDVTLMMPGFHLSGAQELGCDSPQTIRTP